MQPLVVLNTVGLTERLLPHATRIQALAKAGWVRPLREVLPAVTCTVQASFLTGKTPQEHGIVGNGWLFRDTGEIRFWQQSNRLIEAEPIYRSLRRHTALRTAKLFWWFNQGADVDIFVTPKPYYAADGNKAFGILGGPGDLAERLERQLGPFPFPAFWGPLAGSAASEWIARCAALVLAEFRPDLTLVYLPHLDYDLQRMDPEHCDVGRIVGELDRACEPVLDAAQRAGARVWVVNEYGHVAVRRAVLPNRALRQAGLLSARAGPFGENLDTFASRAFAVCDHQVAHIYVRDPEDAGKVGDAIAALPGVARVYAGPERAEVGLAHARAGELVACAERDAWFAYPFWLDDGQAPDYARTVDIHRKPGYDPCELFFDPSMWWPKGRALGRLLQKKLGFRTLFDVVPLDTSLVRGSHGLGASVAGDRPVLIGAETPPLPAEVFQPEVSGLLRQALKLAERP